MRKRHLTITLSPDWKAALRATGKRAKANTYQGEVLSFQTPAQFFGQLTEKRWGLSYAAQGRGALSVRELGRLVGRDVKPFHEDVTVLATLGMLERTERGGLICPFESMHIDMLLQPASPELA